MTKYSKEVLREFQYDKPVYDRKQKPDYMLQPPMAIPGAGASGGTLRPGRSIGALIGAGIGALGGLLTRNKPVKGFIQPGTGGPRRGGRGPRTPNTGGGSGGGSNYLRELTNLLKILKGYLGFGFIGGGLLLISRIFSFGNEKANEVVDKLFGFLPENHKEWIKKNKGIIALALIATAGTAEAARRIWPKINNVLKNRRIAKQIQEALDSGDESMARAILLDAIEEQGVNVGRIRRRLGDDDYERLYRDFL